MRSHKYLASPTLSTWSKPPKKSRNGNRDATMINLAYRHRCAVELVNLRWDQVDIDHARLSAEGSGARRRRIPAKVTSCRAPTSLPANMPFNKMS
jgi:integrase